MTDFRNICLSPSQFSYLMTSNFMSPKYTKHIQRNIVSISDNKIKLVLTSHMAEKFRTIFTDQLAIEGFDESYDLTETGKILEDLIDRFYG